MASRSVVGGLFLLTLGLSAAFACSNYEPPDVANYGPPNGLNAKTPTAPPPTSNGDAGTGTPPPAGDGGTTPAGDGGGTGAQLACVKAGGTLLAPATCAVSWKTDLYPKMINGGALNCGGSACHAIASQPPQLVGDEHSFYTTLANFTTTAASGTGAGQPYLNPCSIDPTKSDFTCNLLAAASGGCGALQMPLGITMAAADSTAISTWIACGAPEN